MKDKTMKDKPWHSIVMALVACIVAIGAFASEAKAQAKKPITLVEHPTTSATSATTADAADTNKEQLAYSIGVQAYLYGQPIVDLYRTFWENTLDPNRSHDRALNEFSVSCRHVSARVRTWIAVGMNQTAFNSPSTRPLRAGRY